MTLDPSRVNTGPAGGGPDSPWSCLAPFFILGLTAVGALAIVAWGDPVIYAIGAFFAVAIIGLLLYYATMAGRNSQR